MPKGSANFHFDEMLKQSGSRSASMTPINAPSPSRAIYGGVLLFINLAQAVQIADHFRDLVREWAATQTAAKITAIARECASFAQDNFDAEDSDDMNAALTPEAIWTVWHDKEGIAPAPELPAGFSQKYWYECERIGGADFAGDIQKLSRMAVPE